MSGKARVEFLKLGTPEERLYALLTACVYENGNPLFTSKEDAELYNTEVLDCLALHCLEYNNLLQKKT